VNIAQVGQARRELSRLKRVAAKQCGGGRPLLEDARFRAGGSGSNEIQRNIIARRILGL
jgi:alkylation response protein AidB-like acyl-CoA dehydrogenase